jgi:hypothetical protein
MYRDSPSCPLVVLIARNGLRSRSEHVAAIVEVDMS